MDCREFSNLLDAFMEESLSEEQASAMRQHIRECEKCASLYAVRMDCRALDEEMELPESFSQNWRQMIREESGMEKTSGTMKKWQRWLAVAAALVFVVGGTLLTKDDLAVPEGAVQFSSRKSGTETNGAYMTNSAARGMMYAAAPTAMEDSMDMAVEEGVREEKIIRNASFTIKTLSFETDVESLESLAREMGGRVEYLSTSGDKENGEMRYGSMTLRIPAARLDEFLSGAQGIGRLTSLQQETQDVTDSYYDVQARLDTQLSKMARLQALLAAAQDISDLIEIESSIADTQYQIDRYTAQLKSYDGKVDFSTVRITIQEIQIQESKEVSLGERMLAGLRQSLKAAGEFAQNCAIFLVAAAPWLLVVGAVILAIVIIKKRKRGKK